MTATATPLCIVVPAPRKILIICHANTSRSVIAEALLKQMLRARGLDDRVSVQSAGIAPFARDGALVSLDARLVLRDEGIDLPPDSVATDLKTNRHLIAEADLILAMTDEQIRMLHAAFPEAAGKEIYTLKAFAGVSGDIEDPAGRDEQFFAACRDEIKACLLRAVERLV
jgi:protein-tyrosine-phosphatase